MNTPYKLSQDYVALWKLLDDDMTVAGWAIRDGKEQLFAIRKPEGEDYADFLDECLNANVRYIPPCA